MPNLHVEWGVHRRLGQFFSERFAERRILIVTDRHLHAAGVIDPALQSLEGAGFAITIFDGVVADPPESVLASAVQLTREAGTDIVLGLGGGSSMDIAKLVAVLAVSEQHLSELYGIDLVKGKRLPLVQMPTTAGTGSEATNISILTTGESTKSGIVAQQLYADQVILDAELTCGMPPLLTAATGIDAIVHAIEAYTSKNRKNPMSDMFAREALRLMTGNLITACRVGNDRDAREAMMLGANLAGQAFANAPVAAVHALAYPLGGHFHIAHGLSNALMLMPVLQFNLATASPLYAELGDAVLGPTTASTVVRAEAFVSFIGQLLVDSGCPLRLRDVEVPQESLPLLARDAMLQTRLLVNNPRTMTEQDALSLYQEAY
ncbi:iron-containing alcohol dehydrogenase [Sphingopyxis sp. P1IMeth2]|uniref:iron-containing alcohol dehydrogenase n=1 Tax=Sphingopyxis sp. P1IMeth2 TaxID=1892848 RepID=UPI001C90D645|nr:iron-containing alcohol dehydrogenase [Sphingopyxis sp. P1IMeth2]